VTDLAVSHGILDQPGTVAFLVIFGMAVILFFVFRSMAKHLRKVQMAARAEAEEAAKEKAAAEESSQRPV
jgi:phosphotransferase system  glucose/maltose/N-acetylglucosamine-specific IIC component